MHSRIFIATLLLALALAGCRGTESDEPPIHLNLNMDFQQRFEAQEPNAFFENDAAMRPLVPGTVARGMLQENVRFFEGRTESGAFVEEMPVPLTRALLERGQERYNIYCAVCHGRAGDGQGVIMTGDYGYVPAPSYHIDRLRQAPDGYIFDVISNGIRNMPAYGAQVPVADRWAIVAYVRALQHSQHVTAEDLPPSILARIEARAGGNIEGGRTVSLGEAGADADTAAGAAQDDAPAASDPNDAPAPDGATAPDEAAPDEAAPADAAESEEAAAEQEVEPAGEEVAEGEPIGEEPVDAPPAVEEEIDAAPAPAAAAADVELEGEEAGLSTTVLIIIFVVLPIIVLMVLLVTAFRKKREH